MSDSIQAADGNNTRTITMQGKSRTILQFNVRHWRRRPWRRKEDRSPCLLILSVFGRECCRSTATYEKVTQQSWWKRQRRRRRRNVPCDNNVDERDRKKKETCDATTKFVKEAKRIDTTTGWLSVPSDYHPKTSRSFPKNTKSNKQQYQSNFRIECHLFRSAKSFENWMYKKNAVSNKPQTRVSDINTGV